MALVDGNGEGDDLAGGIKPDTGWHHVRILIDREDDVSRKGELSGKLLNRQPLRGQVGRIENSGVENRRMILRYIPENWNVGLAVWA